MVETFDYGRGYFLNYPSTNKVGRTSQNTTEEDKKCNRKKVLSRANSSVRNLVNANPQLNKFFTLTFKDNVTDLKYANHQFRCFIKRLNRYLEKMANLPLSMSQSLSSKSVVRFIIIYFAIFRLYPQRRCKRFGAMVLFVSIKLMTLTTWELT